MKIQTRDFGSFQVRVADSIRQFPKWAVKKLGELLVRWIPAFPHEPTLAQNRFGVPSILVRVDCSFQWDDNNLLVYEIEERPAALGVSVTLSPGTRAAVEKWKSQFAGLGAVISPLRRLEDDSLILPTYSREEALSSGFPVIVRAEPEETEFHCLQAQSASVITLKGNREYGVALGLWKIAPRPLPWNKAWVLKTTGSKARAIMLWHPDPWTRKNQQGFSSKDQIVRFLQKHNDSGAYLQELYEPEVLEVGTEDYYLMYRIVFGWNPVVRQYQLLTGSWWARPERIVHGASNAIVGGVSFG